jgi:transposase InsO family protein
VIHFNEILRERPSYGYKRVTVLINAKLKKLYGRRVNHKRVYRIMRAYKLLLQKPVKKPHRNRTGKVQTLLSNTRWCSDSFCIQCENGEQVHVAFSLDTCDREVMRYIASTVGIDGQGIRDLMLETVEYRFGGNKTKQAVQWLSDNGSCYVARETVAFGKTLGWILEQPR